MKIHSQSQSMESRGGRLHGLILYPTAKTHRCASAGVVVEKEYRGQVRLAEGPWVSRLRYLRRAEKRSIPRSASFTINSAGT